MNHHDRIIEMSVEELVDVCIWESIMENTAHSGWTDRARLGLVKNVQDHVKWALKTKGIINNKRGGKMNLKAHIRMQAIFKKAEQEFGQHKDRSRILKFLNWAMDESINIYTDEVIQLAKEEFAKLKPEERSK